MSFQLSSHDRTNLRKAYALRFCDGLVTATLAFAIPVLIYSITHNVKLSGISFMLEWLPRVVAIPLAGPLVDHFGSRQVFFVTSLGRCLFAISVAVGLLIAPHAWVNIVLFGILAGMMAQASFVAAEHMGMALTKGDAHKVQAAQVTIDQAVLVLGPLLGGLLVASGRLVLFGFVAQVSLASFGIARKVHVSHVVAERLHMIRDLTTGFRILAGNRTLLYLSLGLAGTNLLFALIITMTPAFLSQHFQLGSGSVSLVWTCAAICSIITTVFVGKLVDKIGIVTIGLWSTVGLCFVAAVIGFSQSFVIYVVVVAGFMALDSAGSVFLRHARVMLIPKDKYGVTIGAMVLALLVPYPIAGGLVALLPFRDITWILVISAGVTLATIMICFNTIDREQLTTKTSLRLAPEVK